MSSSSLDAEPTSELQTQAGYKRTRHYLVTELLIQFTT